MAAIFAFLGVLYALPTRITLASGAYFVMLATFMGNFALYKNARVLFALVSLWSISVEEQFYAVWPWIARALSRCGLIYFGAALWLFSICCRVWLFHGPAKAHPDRIWFLTAARLDPIACGILLSSSLAQIDVRLRGVHRYALVVLGAGLWIFAAYLEPESKDTTLACMLLGYPAIAVGATAFMLATIGAGAALMRTPAIVRLGRMSYGLYVFHGAAIVLAISMFGRLPRWQEIVLCMIYVAVVTWGAAAISYEWLEAPCLRLKERFTRVASSAAG